MPRSKTLVSKLSRDLQHPIEVSPPSLALNEEEVKVYLDNRTAFVLTERLRKLDILMNEIGAPDVDPHVRLLWTCLELAKLLYPGFETTDNAKPKGRAKRNGPFFGDPVVAVAIVDALKKKSVVKTDKDACKLLLQAEDDRLVKPHHASELDST